MASVCAMTVASSAITALLPVAILERHGSVRLLSVALATYSVGYGIAVFPAGVLSDRFSRKRLLLISLGLAMVGHTGIGLILATRDVVSGTLIVPVGLTGVASALALPQARALLPDVVDREVLVAVNGYLRTVLTVLTVGTPLAVLVVHRFVGVVTVPFASAMFLASAALVTLMLPTLPFAGRAAQRESLWRGAVDGLRYVRRRRWLWSGLVFTLVLAAVVDAFVKIAGPAQADATEYGARAWPFLMSCLALGQCLANLLLRKRRGTPSLFSIYLPTLGAVPALVLFALSESLWAMCAAFLVYSYSFSTFDTLWHSRLQLRTPSEFLGRVVSADQFCVTALRPVGLLGGGSALAALGIHTTGLIAAGVALLSSATALFLLGFRWWSGRPAPAGSTSRPAKEPV